MPLTGGPTDKFGNRFEGRWTIVFMTEVLNETARSIRLEPLGEEGKGVEFWLRRKDGFEFYQIKRQTSSSGYWTLTKLSNELVLQNFYDKLKADEKNICMFISTQAVHLLAEMVDRARRASSCEEFYYEFLKSDKYSEAFDEICQIWNNCPKEDAFNFLKRIYFKNSDEETLRDIIVTDCIKPLIDGNSATIADVLAQYALDEVNKELYADDIWRHLEERDFKRCKWNTDPFVLAAVEDCTDRSLPKHTQATISGKVIARDETKIILDKFGTMEEKHAILISGEAGVGKSGVLLQVVESLRKQGKPLLVFRVDRLEPTLLPDEVGKQFGLPASPANVLKAIAGGRECLLIIDQLDSVSETSGRNPEFFDCIHEIIEQALNYPEMSILLACRKFDLDNDHRFRSLIGKQGFVTVQIRHLPHETIKQFIKNDLCLDINRLNKKQMDLLSIPLHLSLLAEISQDSDIDSIDFETTKDLYDKFWERKQRLLHQRLGDSSRWVDVIFSLSNHMSQHQALIAPASILDRYGVLPEAMASEHILLKDGTKYAFFHQGFFDYAFARNFCAQGYELLPFLKMDEQHLFRRAQVRQILLHERDDNFAGYIADLDLMLNDPKIRFHLKEIVLALLAELSYPTNEEWKTIAPFFNNLSDPLSRESKRILYRSIPWINVLNSEGQLKRWLADAKEENINLAIELLSIIQKDDPDVVIDLIEPYIDVSKTWDGRLSQIFSRSKVDASERFLKLILHFMDEGILDEVKELDPLTGHFWYAQESLIKENPAWACEFLGHYLNRKLIISLKTGQPDPFDMEKGSIPHHVRDEEISNSIQECSERAPEAFIYELLPFMLRVIGFTANHDEGTMNSLWYDRVWQNRYYYDRVGIYISESLLFSMETAFTLLAKTNPIELGRLAIALENLEFETIHYLLIRAYAANGEQFVNDAVNYIMKFPICFETGYVEDRFKAARELLEAVTPFCSGERLAQIESMILVNYPNMEDSDHQKAQFNLFNGIPPHLRSESVNNRLIELEKKFGQLIEEPPKTFGGGIVISPISKNDVDKMSDEDWLEAISTYNSENRSFAFDGSDPIGGALELSRELEELVKRDPSRFAALVQRFSDDSNIYYFDAILRGIKDTDLNKELMLDVCRRCHNLKNRPCGSWICDVIAKIAESDLPDEALDIVAWYATEALDPECEKWRIEGPNKTVYYGGDIVSAGLNSVRGRAAKAMASLIFHDKSRLIYLKSTVEKAVADPSIEVRSWITSMLLSVLSHDRDYAIELFQKLCKTEDILLSTYHVEIFLKYSLRTHFSNLKPILERMISSHESDVARIGSRQICFASFDMEEIRPLMDSCLSGNEHLRVGAAEVFASNVKADPDFCKDKLIKFFSDPNLQVRGEAASCFRHLAEEDLVKFTDLIEAFNESPAFKSDIEDLIGMLDKATRKLPGIVYKVCKKFMESSVSSSNRNYSLEVHASELILRLYSQIVDKDLQVNCLNLIDFMIENDVYRIKRELSNYDR